MMDDQRHMLSSLPLQVLIYFHTWLVVFYIVFNSALFIYKGMEFAYPETSLVMEVLGFLIGVSLVESARLSCLSQGNKKEETLPLLVGIAFAVPGVLGYVHYQSWQTYVLRVDVIVNAVCLGFLTLETLLAAGTWITFHSANRF